jgi:hypothetical protein
MQDTKDTIARIAALYIQYPRNRWVRSPPPGRLFFLFWFYFQCSMATSPFLLTNRTQKWVTDTDLMLWQRSEQLRAKFRYVCGTILFRFEVKRKFRDWYKLVLTRMRMRFLCLRANFKRWAHAHYLSKILSPNLEKLVLLFQKLQVCLAFRKLHNYSDKLYRNYSLITALDTKRRYRQAFSAWQRLYSEEISRSDDMPQVDEIRRCRLRYLLIGWRKLINIKRCIRRMMSIFDRYALKIAMWRWKIGIADGSKADRLNTCTPLRSSLADTSIASVLSSPRACDCM